MRENIRGLRLNLWQHITRVCTDLGSSPLAAGATLAAGLPSQPQSPPPQRGCRCSSCTVSPPLGLSGGRARSALGEHSPSQKTAGDSRSQHCRAGEDQAPWPGRAGGEAADRLPQGRRLLSRAGDQGRICQEKMRRVGLRQRQGWLLPSEMLRGPGGQDCLYVVVCGGP